MSNEQFFLFKFLSVYSMPLSIVLDKWDFEIASDVKMWAVMKYGDSSISFLNGRVPYVLYCTTEGVWINHGNNQLLFSWQKLKSFQIPNLFEED